MSLVEDSPQTRSTRFSVQFKRPSKISVGENGHCGAQTLQVVEGSLVTVIPGDDHLVLTCIFARHQFVQEPGYLHKLGDELVIVSHEPRKLQTS